MAGTSYTRQSTIADGNIITAALFNNEFNQILNAFAYASSGTTGHQHDGGAGEGGNIAKIGDQDFLNKIEVDSTNNRIGLFVQVSSGTVEQVRIQDGAIVPVTDSDVDLGTSSVRFKDAYLDTVSAATITGTGTTNIVTGVVTGDLTLTGAAANVVWDSSENTLEFADDAYAAFGASDDLLIYHDGSNSYIKEAGTGSLYVRADAEILMGSANGATSLTVNGSTGITVASSAATKFTVDANGLSVPDDVKLKFGASEDLEIFHDGSNSWVKDVGTGNLYVQGAANISLISAATTYGVFGTSVDLYYSNSKKFETTSTGATITGNATVTGAVGAQTVNASSSIDTPQIEVTTLKARDGSTAGTIADSTGVVTLASSVLTTADINGGTVDGSVIGGSTAAAGTFTTINGTTSTVTTSNATTVDTTNLEVTNLKAKDGTAAGSIADSTGVVTLASSVLTTADINGGTADNVVIGGSTAAAGTFTTGTIATADINGGAIDGTVIGGSTAAAGSFTTLGATGVISGADLTLTDSTPRIQFNDSDGTNQRTEQIQVGGSFVTTVRNNTSHGAIEFKSNNGTDNLLRFKVASDGDFNFYNSSAVTKMKWDAPNARLGIGTTSPSATLDVVGKIETSEGIYLGGTSGSNLLDDYEEGSWTPVMRDATSGGNVAGASNLSGVYTKIGRHVNLTIRVINVSKTGMTGSNDVYITGLPFAAANLSPSFRHVGTVESTRIDYGSSIQSRITENTSYMILSSSTNVGGLGTINWNAVDDDESSVGVADLFITHTYIAD
jgi:hypothetical protein